MNKDPLAIFQLGAYKVTLGQEEDLSFFVSTFDVQEGLTMSSISHHEDVKKAMTEFKRLVVDFLHKTA